MGANIDDWRAWRDRVDDKLEEHGQQITTLKTYQQIAWDNEKARHARTPQMVFWVVSGLISLSALLLQLWALGGKVTP